MSVYTYLALHSPWVRVGPVKRGVYFTREKCAANVNLSARASRLVDLMVSLLHALICFFGAKILSAFKVNRQQHPLTSVADPTLEKITCLNKTVEIYLFL